VQSKVPWKDIVLAATSAILGVILASIWDGFSASIEAAFSNNPQLFSLLSSVVNAFALLLILVLPVVILYYRRRITKLKIKIEKLETESTELKNKLRVSGEVKLRMDAAEYLDRNKR
jgi:hypothetical protein